MCDLGKSSSSLLGGILLGAILVCTSTVADEAAVGDSPTTGELHIEGEGITKLTLEDEHSRQSQFSAPGAVITLSAGKYRLYEVSLDGGYTCRSYLALPGQWITVGPDQPATLEVGAPLRQVVRAERRGRSMILNYELRGRGGERYAPSSTSQPPTFAVYKGERKVASGDFEYG